MDVLPKPIVFDWDEGNIDKNVKKHGVQNEEAEQVFTNRPALQMKDEKHSGTERRYLLLGKSDGGKRLSIIFTLRRTSIRIISARSMNRKERKLYEEENA